MNTDIDTVDTVRADKQPFVLRMATRALQEAARDYVYFDLAAEEGNDLHLYIDHGRIVIPGKDGDIEIQNVEAWGMERIEIGDRKQFFQYVKLLQGEHTLLNWRPWANRLTLESEGARFTVYATQVREGDLRQIPPYVQLVELDAAVCRRMKLAAPFSKDGYEQDARFKLRHDFVLYNRQLDAVYATDGIVAYTDKQDALPYCDYPHTHRVHRSIFPRMGTEDAVLLCEAYGRTYECVMHKSGVYTYSAVDKAEYMRGLALAHMFGGNSVWPRAAVRARTVVGLLNKYKLLARNSNLLSAIFIASRTRTYMQLPSDPQYITYVAADQPQGLEWPPRTADRYAFLLDADLLAKCMRVLGGDVLIAQAAWNRPLHLENRQDTQRACILMPMNPDVKHSAYRAYRDLGENEQLGDRLLAVFDRENQP